ncbi:hypothetical protein ACWFRF_17485 [Nocardia sp. NPDC055165]
MEMLAAGQRLVVDVEQWVNKVVGRGDVSLGIDNEDGKEPTQLATWGVISGLSNPAEVVPQLFMWADVHVHEETYADGEYDLYVAECVYYDNEGDRIATEDFDSWRSRRIDFDVLHPYANEAGEVDHWRLELTLNDLGRAYLLVDGFEMQDGILLP